MNKRNLLFLLIGLIALFFVISMVIGTNNFVSSAKNSSEKYLNQKELSIAGKVIQTEKVSGKNHLVHIQPTIFHNNIAEKNNSIGFYTSDTSHVFLVLNLPKQLQQIDSIATTAQQSTFYTNHIEIGKSKPELMRWVTMQHLKLETEKNNRLQLEYLY